MFDPTHYKTATLPLPNSISRAPLRRGVLLIAFPLALAWLALSPMGRAEDGDLGSGNTAEGFLALADVNGGVDNTAMGAQALLGNTSGNYNTASGAGALEVNNGDNNTATGYAALDSNTTGTENTATGVFALEENNAGDNTATGFQALRFNTTGSNNTATGFDALANNRTGHDNMAEGFQALLHSTASNNIGLGSNAGANLTTGSNNIDIGANVPGNAGEANTIRIGKSGTQQKTFVAGIHGKTVASGVGVIINSNGQLGTMQSSTRFKDDIKPMDEASEVLLKLKPVTFHYKEELDPEKIPQFGLIAEEAEKVNPALVARDEDGKVATVRNEAVNAMLLNEFLKEHQKAQKLEWTVAKQESDFKATHAQQQKQIEALTATVRKVSERVELRAPAPQIAANED
jgi:hypothetical protein